MALGPMQPPEETWVGTPGQGEAWLCCRVLEPAPKAAEILISVKEKWGRCTCSPAPGLQHPPG